jgi:hypothetical protein
MDTTAKQFKVERVHTPGHYFEYEEDRWVALSVTDGKVSAPFVLQGNVYKRSDPEYIDGYDYVFTVLTSAENVAIQEHYYAPKGFYKVK